MRLIDDALAVCSGPYLAAPADRLRAALVALADAGMLTDPAAARPTAVAIAAEDGGMTAQELREAGPGTYRCQCDHWDTVHGPFCFASGCDCIDFRHASATARPTTAGGLLTAMTRPEACAARSTTGLACTLPGGHDWAHEHQAADSDATTRWAGWSE